MLILQLLFITLSTYYRADFLSLTVVAIAWLYVTQPKNVRVRHFRGLVYLLALSLFNDVIFFYINEYKQDYENGNVMIVIKRFSLWMSGFSFVCKFPLLLILYIDSYKFLSYFKPTNDKTVKEGSEI